MNSVLFLLNRLVHQERVLFSRTSHNEHSTQTFYGRRTNVVESSERAWQPGQYILSVWTELTDDIHSLLAGMQ